MSKTGKGLKRALCTLLAMLMCLTVICVPTEVYALGISSSSFTLTKGYSKTLYVTGTSDTVKWTTSDKKIATVSSKGKVVGKGAGTATITATVNGTKLTSKVKVIGGKLSLSAKKITLDAGTTSYVTLTAKGSKGMKISYSDKSIASAAFVKPWDGNDIRLKVSGKKAGTAKITVTLTSYPDISTSLTVIVEGDSSSAQTSEKDELVASTSTVTAKTGETQTVNVYTNKNNSLEYVLGDNSIASVSEGSWSNGNVSVQVKGLKAGNTTLKIYRKDNASLSKTISITVTEGGYYTVSESYPTRTTVNDLVIQYKDPGNGYTRYMLVPYDYDKAKASSAFAKYAGKYDYNTVYDVSPTKQYSSDSIKEFKATVNNASVTRYVLVAQGSDEAEVNTAIAEYTGTYEYWTIYNVSLENRKIYYSDIEKTWTATVNYKTVTRHMLVPLNYDETKLNNIIAKDTGSYSGGYYGVSITKPALKASTDKILDFTATTLINGASYTATYYVLVPQNYDEAKFNDAVASINGYDYWLIYTKQPAKKFASDVIEQWTKIVDSKSTTRYMLLPPGYSVDLFQNKKNSDLASQTTAYYMVSTIYPTAVAAGDIVWDWVNPNTNTRRYMLLPANYSARKKNDVIAADTGIYDYYTVYSAQPRKKADTDEIISSRNASGVSYMLVPKDRDESKVQAGFNAT